MNNDRCKYVFVIMLATIFILVLLQMNNKQYRDVDETISYSMSYSLFDGWMNPTGKIGEYLSNKTDTYIIKTIINYFDVCADVIKNGRSAIIFNLQSIKQTKWHTREEVYGWSHLTSKTRFNFVSAYYNGMTDGGNPPLYYILLNFVGSLMFQISSSNWCAYIINILALAFSIFIVYKLCKEFEAGYGLCIATVAIWAMMPQFYLSVIFERAYEVETVFILAILYYHVQIMKAIYINNIVQLKKGSLQLSIYLILGLFTHYLTLVVEAISFILLLGYSLLIVKGYIINKREMIKMVITYLRYLLLSFIAACIVDINLLKSIISFVMGKYSEVKGLTWNIRISTFLAVIENIFVYDKVAFIFAVILFIVIICLIIRKQIKIKSIQDWNSNDYTWYYLLIFTVTFYFAVLLKFCETRYFYVIAPITALLFAKLLYGIVITNRKAIIAFGVVVLLLTTCGYVRVYDQYNLLSKNLETKDAILSSCHCDTAIVCGTLAEFPDFSLLDKFDNVYIDIDNGIVMQDLYADRTNVGDNIILMTDYIDNTCTVQDIIDNHFHLYKHLFTSNEDNFYLIGRLREK